jgi:hypothetical protein
MIAHSFDISIYYMTVRISYIYNYLYNPNISQNKIYEHGAQSINSQKYFM